MLRSGIDLPFTNGFYKTRSLQNSAQRCINYFPVPHSQPSLTPESLFMSPGLTEYVAASGGHARGAHLMNGKPYFVKGDRLVRVDRVLNPDLTETVTEVDLGQIPGSGRVIMKSGLSDSGYDLVIVTPGVSAYSYNTSTGTITDLHTLTNFLDPVIDVIHVNGVFLFLQQGTNTLFHSNVNNALLYNALDDAPITAVTNSAGLIKYRNRPYLMADDQIIPFVFVGGSTFIFQAQVNAAIDSGLRAVHAKVNIRQAFVYLGEREGEEPAIWLYTGGVPQKISTEPLDFIIQNLTETELDNAFMMKYSQSGSDFILFIAGDECFVYDLLSGKWTERRSTVECVDRRYRVNAIVKAYNKILAGDAVDGRIGVIDDESTTEYGTPIFRSFVLQPFDDKGKAILAKEVLAVMDSGFGGEINMDISTDFGHTWTNAITESAGEVGDYGRIVSWDQLGEMPFAAVLRFGTSTTSKCHVNRIIARV